MPQERSLPRFVAMIPSGCERFIGYYGFPSRAKIAEARLRFGPDLPFIDLDIDHGAPDSGLLPATTCRIISNIMDNTVFFAGKIAGVVAAVGEGKCDRGRHTAFLLRSMGFDVIESRFSEKEYENRKLVWSTGRGDLSTRVSKIMDTVIDPDVAEVIPPACEPTHGFWGVPPHDFGILELFPPTTHIYGWTRCVEAGRPSDIAMESYVDAGVPTVFFTQSFCAKQDMAHYLAERYGGIEVDCHRNINDSIMAKVEAFIKLS